MHAFIAFLAFLVVATVTAFSYENNNTAYSYSPIIDSDLLASLAAKAAGPGIAKRIPAPEVLFASACKGVELNKAIQDMILATSTGQQPNRQGPFAQSPLDGRSIQAYNGQVGPNCGNLGDVATILQNYNIPFDNSFVVWTGSVS